MIIILALFAFISCTKKPSAPKAGSAKAEDMLSLIPKEAKAVFFVDFHRVMEIEVLSKFIQENGSHSNYQGFIEKTGVDPQKDIYFIAGSVSGEMVQPKQKGMVIINLKYNRDSILSLLKEKGGKELLLSEKEYDGFTIYSIKENQKEGACFSFIDESNILAGDEAEVKSSIDVFRGKKDNVFKNKEISSLLAKTNKEALFWGAVVFPPEAMNKVVEQSPMLSSLESLTSASIYFDYRDKNIVAEIKAMSTDQAKHQEIADFLNGIKSMAAMITIQNLNAAEILDRIEITSGPDHVKIYASFPEGFVEELGGKLKAAPSPAPPLKK